MTKKHFGPCIAAHLKRFALKDIEASNSLACITQIPSEAVLRSFVAAAAECEPLSGVEGTPCVWRVRPALAQQHGLPERLPQALVRASCLKATQTWSLC